MGKGKRLKQQRSNSEQRLIDRDMQRIMVRQINKQLAKENDRFYADELMVILYVLHTKFGFGEKRLLQFVREYGPAITDLRNFYDMSEDETPWICKKKLEESSVNMDLILKVALVSQEDNKNGN